MKVFRRPLFFSLLTLLLYSPADRPAEDPDHNVAEHPVLVLHPDAKQVERKTFPYLQTDERTLSFDVYYPPGMDHTQVEPAVILFNGAGDRSTRQLKEWRSYRSWGRLMAASGITAVMADARFESIFEDQEAFFAHLMENGGRLGIDISRLGLWAVSSNVTTGYPFAVEHPEIRAAAYYYGSTELEEIRDNLSLFLILVGGDNRDRSSEMAQRLSLLAISSGNDFEFIFYKEGRHAFDLIDKRPETRRLIRRTLEFFHRTLDTGKNLNWKEVTVPPGTDSMIRKAAAAWFVGDEAEVARLYASYLESHPDDGLAHYRYAVAVLECDPAEAKEHFQRSLQLGYSVQSNHYQLSRLALAGERRREALDHLNKSLEAGLNVDMLWREPWREIRHLQEVRELVREHAPKGEVSVVPPDEPGLPLVIEGRLVCKESGDPLTDALLYLYQTDATGVYNRKEESNDRPRLYGFVRTDSEARFRVKTIRPASYPNSRIASHVHYVYFPETASPQDGEILFEDDPLLTESNRIHARQQDWPIVEVRQVDQPFTGWTTPRSHRGETFFGKVEVEIRLKREGR